MPAALGARSLFRLNRLIAAGLPYVRSRGRAASGPRHDWFLIVTPNPLNVNLAPRCSCTWAYPRLPELQRQLLPQLWRKDQRNLR
jgi:hypothetical protein